MRWKIALLIVFAFHHFLQAQNKRYFSIADDNEYDKVHLTLNAKSGSCFIKPSKNVNIVNIYSLESNQKYQPNLKSHINDRVQYVNFNLNENQKGNMGKTLSQHIFGDHGESAENQWDVFLSRNKPFDLNLNYVVGDAKVDLSGLPVENLKINTGNADVHIGYFNDEFNPVDMDSFQVKVDFGSLQIDKINLSNARHIVADVGFGNLLMDFSQKSYCQSEIKASVGAGSLEIVVPEKQVPMMIKVNNSPLCHVKLLKSFRKLENNIFVNKAYTAEAPNLIIFDLDVTMGNIKFIAK
ncbi:MAG: hypothetical protein ACNS62_10680 [Candidatus Cyclobacteriaceae bacterium M3_2C_046]